MMDHWSNKTQNGSGTKKQQKGNTNARVALVTRHLGLLPVQGTVEHVVSGTHVPASAVQVGVLRTAPAPTQHGVSEGHVTSHLVKT